MGDGYWNNWVFNLLPTVLVGLIFWVVMRAIFRADRTERKVYAQIEAEERARLDRDNGPASREA
jgi:cytochrome c-type biogenesis protein CcmH/NrfF